MTCELGSTVSGWTTRKRGDSAGTLGVELGVKNANPNAQQTAVPIFSPANYAGSGQSRSLPILRRENTFEELDNVTWTRSAHTFKFGVDVRRRQITEYQTNRGNGRFNFKHGAIERRVTAGLRRNPMLLS